MGPECRAPPVAQPTVQKTNEYIERWAARDAREAKWTKVEPTQGPVPKRFHEGGSSSSNAPPVQIPRDRPSERDDERKVRQRLSALDEANICLARYITGEPAERKDRWTVGLDLEQAPAGVTPGVIYGVSQSIKKVHRDVLRIGIVFDLRTGWNLSRASDRRKFWATLEVEDPKL